VGEVCSRFRGRGDARERRSTDHGSQTARKFAAVLGVVKGAEGEFGLSGQYSLAWVWGRSGRFGRRAATRMRRIGRVAGLPRLERRGYETDVALRLDRRERLARLGGVPRVGGGSGWQRVAAGGSGWQRVAAGGSGWQQRCGAGPVWRKVRASLCDAIIGCGWRGGVVRGRGRGNVRLIVRIDSF
jgi:hypothetical protein